MFLQTRELLVLHKSARTSTGHAFFAQMRKRGVTTLSSQGSVDVFSTVVYY